MYSATGDKFWVFGCSKMLVIDVNGYFSAAGGQNSEHLYQMSMFSYWNLHIQSLESKVFSRLRRAVLTMKRRMLNAMNFALISNVLNALWQQWNTCKLT